ncbi:chemotaxis protein CheW [Haloarcula onubensis]|uniref:Chemotaxis protein CheW n=1 Tax=Haloarcula onubensis TaxID=2950539 RepID=A0ABU2FS03_9EURY|nr:chemotaxis protein CheW [Halomicroarcula sp. S3CR25-11]MDS0283031.1 chemotaxis protein CheW [Halomicroarcula sp. S3CR25-11]
MSDDRMDRAERIRNMREGNRGTDDRTADTAADAADGDDQSASTGDTDPSTDDSAASEPDDAGPADSATSEPDETGFSSLTTDAEDGASTAERSADRADETADTSAAARAAEAAAAAVESEETPAASGGDAASDAQAAAQRAAESAAAVMGTEDAGQETAATGTETTGQAQSAAADETPTVPAGATGASTVPGDISGVELPDQQLLEEAMATSSVETTEGGARAAMEGESTQSEETVRVLEFSLGEEYYCLDIEYVEEIVKRDTVTRVPNTPAFVDGVVDLRGQITTILEPKEMMDIESEGEQNLIIVFDPEQFEDQGAIGWVVDEVRQVVPIPESEVNHPPVDADYINGVVDRDEYEQFVIWVEPEDALAQATATDDE